MRQQTADRTSSATSHRRAGNVGCDWSVWVGVSVLPREEPCQQHRGRGLRKRTRVRAASVRTVGCAPPAVPFPGVLRRRAGMPYVLISTQIRLVCSCVFVRVRVRECFVATAATAAVHRDALELGASCACACVCVSSRV